MCVIVLGGERETRATRRRQESSPFIWAQTPVREDMDVAKKKERKGKKKETRYSRYLGQPAADNQQLCNVSQKNTVQARVTGKPAINEKKKLNWKIITLEKPK